MRGSSTTIKWETFTYGKMIGICTQKGLNLCNDLKLSRQIKMQQMKERAQLGDFCDKFGMKEPFPYRKKKSRYKNYRKAQIILIGERGLDTDPKRLKKLGRPIERQLDLRKIDLRET